MLPSKLPGKGAGARAPALGSPFGNRFLIQIPAIAVLAVLSWQSGTVIGRRLGQQRLLHARAALPALESLFEQITATLHEQGVCLDAPSPSSAPDADTASHIDALRDRFAILTSCVDLAIAQTDFETLQISRATVTLIHQRQLLTTGFLADSLAFHRQREASRLRRAHRQSRKTNTERRTRHP